jgi:hypothetical protein
MPYRRARSWREWFFEVFVPSGEISLLPLSKNNVELMEEAGTSLLPKDMSRLRVESDQSPRIVTPTRDP